MNEFTLVHPDAATTIFNLHEYRVLGAQTLSFGERRIHVESTVESECPGCGVIGTRRHFPNDAAVVKLLWLTIRDIEVKRARERATERKTGRASDGQPPH